MLLEKARKNIFIYKMLQRYESKFRKILSTVSPAIASRYLYRRAFNTKLNLKNPQTFNEKLIWLKLNLYYNNPLVTECADKFRVRNYVKKYELDYLLNDFIGEWDSVDEIDWSSLPNRFALKCNHGSGYNIICVNKDELDINKTKKTLQKWMSEDYWKKYAEVNYKFIKKKIICEKYLDTKQGFLPIDYKIYCFNGEPKAILVMSDRDKEATGVFMDEYWNFMSIGSKYKKTHEIPEKPHSLKEMLEAATKLSKPFPYVRVDFYQHNNKPIFGEMTFTPAGGLYVSQTKINGREMGDFIDISGIKKGDFDN